MQYLTKGDERAIERASARGLSFIPFGRGWWLHGKGVDVLMDRPARLHASDLLPFTREARYRRTESKW